MNAVLLAAAGFGAAIIYALTRRKDSAPVLVSPSVMNPAAAPDSAAEILPDFIYLQGADDVPQSTSGSRGIRNNNPGNIRISKDKWLGLAATQDDPAFFKFTHARYGVRAMGKILLNYEKKYGLNTVRQLITRWAPGHENPTDAYVAYVARLAGVEPDQTIVVYDHVGALVNAIIRFENGKNPYNPSEVNEWAVMP